MLPPAKAPPPPSRPSKRAATAPAPKPSADDVSSDAVTRPAPIEDAVTRSASLDDAVTRDALTRKTLCAEAITREPVTREPVTRSTMSDDEFTRLLTKNLGEPPPIAPEPHAYEAGAVRNDAAYPRSSREDEPEERTHFRPFGGDGSPEDMALRSSAKIPLRPPAAGTPAVTFPTSPSNLTPFAPLTPERIQAQLEAAREARRLNRAQKVAHFPHAGSPNKYVSAANEVKELLPSSRSMALAPFPRRKPRPKISWPFALAAMAIVGSLATVAIVQGSGDDLLRTGASFVDPGAMKAEVPKTRTEPPRTEPPRTEPPRTEPPRGPHTEVAGMVPPSAPIPVLDLPPVPPSPIANPAPEPAPAPPANVAIEPRPKPALAPPRAEAPALGQKEQPKAERADKPAHKHRKPKSVSSDDVANAAAADALAREQLQQSL